MSNMLIEFDFTINSGGTSGNEYCRNIYKFCLSDKKWLKMESTGCTPPENYRTQGYVLDHEIICFGGSVEIDLGRFHSVHVFDLKSNRWSKRNTASACKDFPVPRVYESFAFSKTHGYMSGGKTQFAQVLTDIWSIDFKTLTWQKLNYNLKEGLFFHTSVVYNDTVLYVFGGTRARNHRVNWLEKFNIDVPSLLNISLPYVFNPHNYNIDKEIQLPPPLQDTIVDCRF
ncbi:hypothetical protein MXB_3211 [Myxobolus squamalis]|nr:hypothetical protein MXB_3211 [Myxobolus squamalis]